MRQGNRMFLFFSLVVSTVHSVYAGPVVITSEGTTQVLPIATEGTGCTATADRNTAIRSDYKSILSCQGGVWTKTTGRYFREPVSSYSSLPTSNNEVGDVRVTTDTGRLFVWTGTQWDPVSIDQNGNLNVPQDLTVQRDATVNRNLNVGNNVDIGNKLVVAGDICSTSLGLCFSEVKYKLPKFVHKANYTVTNNSVIFKPYCENGGIPKILTTMHSGVYAMGGIRTETTVTAYDYGGYWITRMISVGTSASSANVYGIASVYCFYN